MTINLSEVYSLPLSNRDGDLYLGKTKDNTFWLILTTDTLYLPETFPSLGPSTQIEIGIALYEWLLPFCKKENNQGQQ